MQEDNVKMDLKEMEDESVDWIDVILDGYRKTVIRLCVA
jgi:hypothetical protein